MNAVLIGFFSGILVIGFITVLKRLDKKLMYSLILTGIGFLYVGYVWTDRQALVVNSIQAIFFLFLSYYGMKRNSNILAFGYFLHGTWDLAYKYFADSTLIPPHYDLFCLTIDFTIGIYLLILSKQSAQYKSLSRRRAY